MNNLIEPVSRALIVGELSPDKLIRKTGNGSNEIYVVAAGTAPHTMREIGRLRELSFRTSGGGTGADIDIDADDISPMGYRQLIVWDPQQQEIIGGYRFMLFNNHNVACSSTRHYFDFSETFVRDYLPYTLELGRSFIQPQYQGRSGNPKGIFALDNLWDGLGALVSIYDVKYLFGKVTMYKTLGTELIDSLYALLSKYFETSELALPKPSIAYHPDYSEHLHLFEGLTYEEAFKVIVKNAKEVNETYPPLFAAYAKLSATMKVFGTVVNHHFGDVLETGIMITVQDVSEDKYDRYVNSYDPSLYTFKAMGWPRE